MHSLFTNHVTSSAKTTLELAHSRLHSLVYKWREIQNLFMVVSTATPPGIQWWCHAYNWASRASDLCVVHFLGALSRRVSFTHKHTCIWPMYCALSRRVSFTHKVTCIWPCIVHSLDECHSLINSHASDLCIVHFLGECHSLIKSHASDLCIVHSLGECHSLINSHASDLCIVHSLGECHSLINSRASDHVLCTL